MRICSAAEEFCLSKKSALRLHPDLGRSGGLVDPAAEGKACCRPAPLPEMSGGHPLAPSVGEDVLRPRPAADCGRQSGATDSVAAGVEAAGVWVQAVAEDDSDKAPRGAWPRSFSNLFACLP